MSEETEATQGLPEGETVLETAPNEAPETVTEQTPEEPEEEAPKPKHKPWFQERIDQLTREKHDERRAREAAEARLAQSGSEKPDAAMDVDQLAEHKAETLVRQRQFDDKCNAIYSTGSAEFADFDEKLSNFRMLGGLPPAVLEAVAEFPDAPRVLHALGSNMDEAARIINLPPVPMAVALAKLASAPKAKPVSNAPSPIRPIDGTPKGEPDPDKMSTADWVKWREEQLSKR